MTASMMPAKAGNRIAASFAHQSGRPCALNPNKNDTARVSFLFVGGAGAPEHSLYYWVCVMSNAPMPPSMPPTG
jgi:hypothetical protein